jgi:hypothetical protein
MSVIALLVAVGWVDILVCMGAAVHVVGVAVRH